MRNRFWISCTVVPLLVLFAGCSAFMKADILLARKDYTGAIKLYHTYLANHPGDPDVSRNLGFAYFKEGLWDQAAEAFQSSLAGDPEDSFSIVYLGATYLRQNKFPLAAAVWEQFEDDSRPRVKEEIERQLALLRSLSRTAGSTVKAKAALAGQMSRAAEKVETVWSNAEIEDSMEGGGKRSGDGGGEGGGSGSGGGGGG